MRLCSGFRPRIRPLAVYGGGYTPTPVHSIITYKVAVYAPAERAYTLPVFHLYPYVLCDLDERAGSVSTFAVVLKLSGQGKVLGYWGESGE